MTATQLRSGPSPEAAISTSRRRLAFFALALGGFGIGASEFVSMGLLPGIANTLMPEVMATEPEQGIARAGHAISAYAIGVVVGAPTLSMLAVRMSRTRMIIVLAIALAAGTLLSAIMPTFELTVAARFLAGIPHGAYFGVASLIAASLMGPGNQGKGVAMAMSGLAVANLAGVPVFTALGQVFGWRAVYALVAVIFVVTVGLLLRTLPPQEAPTGRGVLDELQALRRRQLWMVIGIVAIGFAGSFTVFSYIADIAQNVAGASASFVPFILAAAGLGMTIGNVIGGFAADRSLFGTLVVGFAFYILAILGVNVFSGTVAGLLVTFALMNMMQSVLGPALQGWLMRISRNSEVLGASVHHAAFNIANALGAFAGGTVISAGWGMRAPAALGLALACLGFVMTLTVLTLLRLRARRRQEFLRTAGIALIPTVPPRAASSVKAARQHVAFTP